MPGSPRGCVCLHGVSVHTVALAVVVVVRRLFIFFFITSIDVTLDTRRVRARGIILARDPSCGFSDFLRSAVLLGAEMVNFKSRNQLQSATRRKVTMLL